MICQPVIELFRILERELRGWREIGHDVEICGSFFEEEDSSHADLMVGAVGFEEGLAE